MAKKDLEELEAELFSEGDGYTKDLQEKTERKLLVSNFLESKEQSRISKLSGVTLTNTSDINQDNQMLNRFISNASQTIAPLAITMMCGTFTYPIAVRIAKRVFRLRGFYPIHFSIAPFLGLVHVNVFGTVQTYFMIKVMEREFEMLRP